MVTYRIKGKDFPMALTLKAMDELDQQYGGIENLPEAFDGKTAMGLLSICVDMLIILMKGGRDYQIEMEGQAEDVPSKETLACLLMPKDIAEIKTAIFASIKESMNHEVELEPDQKNAETTQGM